MEVSINGARIIKVIKDVPLLGEIRITQTLLMSWVVMLII